MNPFAVCRRVVLCIALLVGGLCGASEGRAAQAEPTRLIPPDTFLLLTVSDVKGSIERFKRTPGYGLYKDPAMQKFIVPAEERIRKLIREKLEEAWKKAGVEQTPLEKLVPEGRVALAMRMGTRTISVPVYDWENFEGDGDAPKIKEWKEQTIPVPQQVVWADMGDNADAIDDDIPF